MHTATTGNGKTQLLSLWLTLLLIWLVANNSLALEIVLVGAALAAVLAILFSPGCMPISAGTRVCC